MILTQDYIDLFKRDLIRLKKEVAAYSNEEDMWTVQNQVTNSAGNLTLHLIGGLNHFVGAILGKSGYERQRDLEFSAKHVAQSDLLLAIDKCIEVVVSTLASLDEATLEADYPVEVFKKPMSTKKFVLHLYGHLTYHLGQINYHRRLLTPAETQEEV